MDQLFERRAGFNEATFRELNESIDAREPTGRAAFRCECARLGCTELIELGREDYEAVRSHPRRFFVLAGHELPEVEDVVERRDGYFVVEKRGVAGEIA